MMKWLRNVDMMLLMKEAQFKGMIVSGQTNKNLCSIFLILAIKKSKVVNEVLTRTPLPLLDH